VPKLWCGRTLHHSCVDSTTEPTRSNVPMKSAYLFQSRNGDGTPQRGKVRVKISLRTLCRPVSWRSRKGELAETASSSGSSSRSQSQTAIALSAPRIPMCRCRLQVLLRWATQPSSLRSRL
jgi:hypothetical protein